MVLVRALMNNFISDLKYRHFIAKFAKCYDVTRASNHFNVSRFFIYKLLNRFDGTIDSLKSKPKRHHKSPNKSKADKYELVRNYPRRNLIFLIIMRTILRPGSRVQMSKF